MTRRPFTFAELLATMLLMAVVLPVSMAGIRLAGQCLNRAALMEQGARLADLKLSETVVTRSWESGDESGDFADDYPGWRWETWLEDWQQDESLAAGMTMLNCKVTHAEGGQDVAFVTGTLITGEELE